MTKQTPHYHGHRERLRRRVLDKGVVTLSDLDVLEYLLFGARPRGDTPPPAKPPTNRFCSPARLLTASRPARAEATGRGRVRGPGRGAAGGGRAGGWGPCRSSKCSNTGVVGARPRGDTKRLAKALTRRVGGRGGVLSGSRQELGGVEGLGEAAIAALKIVPEAARRLALEEASERPVIASWDKLLAYCRIAMGHEKVEQFRLLFLDKKNVHSSP